MLHTLRRRFLPVRADNSQPVVAEAIGPASPPSEQAAEGERTHAEIMFIMTALMISMLLSALDQSIVATALPQIASDLNGLTKLSWVVTAYLITTAISTPIYGKLGDLYGRKKVFQSAIVIFLLGSALCGLSRSMNQLVIFRALQGIGAGGLMSLAIAIIGDVIPPRQRGKYQGYFGAVFGVASVAGPVLGGLFASAHHFLGITGWRWIFYVNLPLGVIALSLVASRLHLHKPAKKENNIDYGGAILLAVAVVCLVFVTVWGGVDYAWTSWQILSLMGGDRPVLAAFRAPRAAHHRAHLATAPLQERHFQHLIAIIIPEWPGAVRHYHLHSPVPADCARLVTNKVGAVDAADGRGHDGRLYRCG